MANASGRTPESQTPGVVVVGVAVAVGVVGVVVDDEWSYYSKRIIMVRWADLSDFFFRSFASEKCVFLFHVQ